MLKKFRRIKNLGLVFKDFTWNNAAPDFREVNLIYGWNGSGKTTLTRLFEELSSETLDAEYELEDSEGNLIAPSVTFDHPVRVFNQSYIQRNVRVLDAQAEAISVVLGAENQELLAKIAAHEAQLNGDPKHPEQPGLVYKTRQNKQKLDRMNRRYDKLFTDAASSIRAAAAGSAGVPRNYRSPDAKRDHDATEGRRNLDDTTLNQRLSVLHQEALEPVGRLEWPSVELDVDRAGDACSALQELHREVADLLSQTPEAVTLEKLVRNPDIANWVEQGQQLHAQHDPHCCEYCGGTVSEKRLRELALHFSQADTLLRAALDHQTQYWRSVYAAIDRWELPDKARLYSDLRSGYEELVIEFVEQKAALLLQIAETGKALVRKRASTHEIISAPDPINTESIASILKRARSIAEDHDKRCADFAKTKITAFRDVRDHYLSEIYEEARDIARLSKELESEIGRDDELSAKLANELRQFRAEVSSAHRACELLNGNLAAFLGRAELRFEPQPLEEEEVTAFGIFRGDQPAVHLSEGEKTAIAFVYFVVHLNDGTLPPGSGVIVIDDPISSLDSNSLYQAFAFLKGAVKDRHQVFLLTHNFDFLKLLLNWRSRSTRETSYYMIGNRIVDGMRRADIAPMDKVLRHYETEYLWLFKKLKQMREEQDGTITAAYPVPNMARKLWDSFLMFRVPTAGTPHHRMELLKEEGCDAQKLDAVYKFTNDQSHITGSGFDPALVPETMNALTAIFDLMKECAPDHYRILENATA